MDTVITSTKNDIVKAAKSLHTKKGRESLRQFLVDGPKCVTELIEYAPQLILHFFVLSGAQSSVNQSAQSVGPVHFVAPHVLAALSGTKSPQEITAVAAFPEAKPPKSGFVLALDELQDPQNVGTMIRTADAAGAAGVALSPQCADPLSPKAVRASMGSIFHLPVFHIDLPEYINRLKSSGYAVLAADMGGVPEYTYDWDKTCLVIGNEARGVSEAIRNLSTALVSVPMYGKAESLNAAAAAAVLIYQLRT